MSGEVNTNVYKDPYGNSADSIKYHSDGSDIKNGITTFADGKHAVVYDGKTKLSVFLAQCSDRKKTYTQEEINNILVNADRQNDDIEYNGTKLKKLNTPLQAGDVIILDNNNVKTVNQYKQQLATEEKEKARNEAIKAHEKNLAKMKKDAWSLGIGTAGAAATVGLLFVGWPFALAAASLTGVVYCVRGLVNIYKEEKAELEELQNQE